MKLKQLALNLAVIPAVVGLALTAHNLQAEDKVETVEIQVKQENDQDSLVELAVNGVTEKFTLADLANGETRTIVTESGKTITASKDDNGSTTISIDGKDIKLFDFRGDMGANFNVFHTDDAHASYDFGDKIMILGGNLSDEAKAAVKATLKSYNVTQEVVFPDASNSKMMFITKDVIHSGEHGDVDMDIELIDDTNVKVIKRIEKK
ncbi:MAG: hypothetical protein HWE16_15985 [Gammaproteobacteria bacterium]|nr:hypothetical protein [Gammaproteobacteria bacterium]